MRSLVLCSGPSAVDIVYEPDHEIYIISNPMLFSAYIASLVSPPPENVIIIHSSILETIKLLKLLYDHMELSNELFTSSHTHYWPQQPAPPGHGDKSIGCNLVLALDMDRFGNDPLSKECISAQQHLRIISLKHGATFVMVSNTKSSTKHSNAGGAVGQLLALVAGNPNAVSIYDDEKTFQDGNFTIHTLIPRAWDSWSRIVLVATASIASPGQGRTFTTEEDCVKYCDEYDELLSSKNSGQKTHTETTPPQPITFEQLLASSLA